MSPHRQPCPVLTCDRDMPVGQVMCSHCWAKVPKSLRTAVDRSTGGARQQHVRNAVHAAQAVPR